jgi:hypothetical protein
MKDKVQHSCSIWWPVEFGSQDAPVGAQLIIAEMRKGCPSCKRTSNLFARVVVCACICAADCHRGVQTACHLQQMEKGVQQSLLFWVSLLLGVCADPVEPRMRL